MRIERHPIALTAAELADSVARRTMDDCELAARIRAAEPRQWYWFFQSGWDQVALLSALPGGDLGEAPRVLERAARLGAAYLAVHSGRNGEVAVRFEPAAEPRIVPAAPASSTANLEQWDDAFHAAVIARASDCLDELARVPVDVLARSSTRYDPWPELLVRTEQAYWLREDDAPTVLRQALEATAPERAPIAANAALRYGAPMLGLLYRLMLRDEAGFNADLVYALEQHRELWKREPRDEWGFLARGPLAMCCFAHDLGMRIDVESDYIPRALIETRARAPLCTPLTLT